MTTIIRDGQAIDAPRDKIQAIWRGLVGRCPECGKGAMFHAYLKVNDHCPACHEELHHQRADDMPPYITMFIVAHIVVASLLATDALWSDAPVWLEAIVWSAVTAGLSLILLPRVKGALVALQWSLRMHGFSEASPIPDRATPPL